MMAPDGDDRTHVSSVETSFSILEALKEEDGARVTELADSLSLAKSTVHRHLQTLLRNEAIVKEGDVYYVGLKFLEFGEYTRSRKEAFDLIETKVSELAEETQERVQFLVEEHGRTVYVYRETGQNAVRTDPGIGKRTNIHASAAGKAVLAHMPETRVEEIIERRGLPAMTEHTITEPDSLLADLEQVRERGYSMNNQENLEGLRAVGVPVRSDDGAVLGGLSVSGPTYRFNGERIEEGIPNLLLGAANELELNIKHL